MLASLFKKAFGPPKLTPTVTPASRALNGAASHTHDAFLQEFAGELANPGRYAASRQQVPVNFSISAPQATSVSLVGDFNKWDARVHPMQPQVDGSWLLQVILPHGRHRYLFLIDGKRVLDPRSNGTGRGAGDEKVSICAVS